ncbi:MAG: helix-turn-helix domain-containing protein [Chloroflexi bacterium]|nr:helix-turn-helix domain-containing protein [Chloroflexota bacterium]
MRASLASDDIGSEAGHATDPLPDFGALLRGHRLRAGLSQEMLAERAALSPAAVSALEHGRRRRPHPRTVSALSEALDLAPDDRRRLQEAAQRGGAATAPTQLAVEPAPVPAERAATPAPKVVRGPVGLPPQLTSFVGREAELADLRRLLATARLLTLVGSPGVGKTRLAVQVAVTSADHYRDGVVFVDLAPLIDPGLVPEVTREALGVRPQPGLSSTAALGEALADRQLLVVLDNCEHVVDAAAGLVNALLRVAPGLRVLTTSRQPLVVPGEVVWRVSSLPVPSTDATPPTVAALLEYSAIRLFAERAAAASPGFVVSDANAGAVTEICSRLDGIPLAVELAASRVRLLGVDQIRRRLDDRFALLVEHGRFVPERQQTLRATLDWSYALLSPVERRVFAQLAVFAGSWSVEAAEGVCGGADLQPGDVLHVLGNLVDHSLVLADRQEHGLVVRYRLLETMRQYATEHLAESGEETAARDRHLHWYLEQAEQVPLQRFDESHLRWLAAEYDNLRASLRWSIDSGQLDAGLRLAVACSGYWQVRGSPAEGRRWLAELLELGAAELDSSAAASALNMASQLAMVEWDIDAAHALVERCLAVAERLGDRRVLGYAHLRRGIIVARIQADLTAAEAELRQALSLGHELGDPYLQVYGLYSLGLTLYSLRDQKRAEDLGQQLLALATSLGHAWGIIRGHRVLGRVALTRGALDTAGSHFEASLAQSRALADLGGMVGALLDLGQLAVEQAAPARAHAAFAEALPLARNLGDKLEMVRTIEGLAGLIVRAQPERAVYLLGAAGAARATLRAEPYAFEQPSLARWRDDARRVLGEQAYLEAERAGAGAPLDAVCAIALAPMTVAKKPRRLTQAAGVLTPRQRQVAGLVGRGLSNRELAERLVVTEGTARVHVARVRAKLNLRSRAALAGWAVRNGLADVEAPGAPASPAAPV